MRKYSKFIFSFLLIIGLFGLVVGTLAFSPDPSKDEAHAALVGEARRSLNPLNYSSMPQVTGVIIRVMMTFMGSIAMLLYVWAGFVFMTAAGNAEKVKQAIAIFVWTSLGVVVMLGSYVIINFVFTSLQITAVKQ